MMSNRTILEINHDYWIKIENDPVGFAQEIVTWLKGCSHDSQERLRSFGAKPLATIHHSSAVNVSFVHKP